jgi:hypothetical protein
MPPKPCEGIISAGKSDEIFLLSQVSKGRELIIRFENKNIIRNPDKS